MRRVDADAGYVPPFMPPHVKHGGWNAYGHYKCRCNPCREWRREYDRNYAARNQWLRATNRAACRQYLKERGVQLLGHSPLVRNPHGLATMVSVVLGEDLYAYVQTYRKEHPQ